MADLPGDARGFAGARLQGEGSRSAGDPHRPRMVPLVAELRGHERHAAEELERWKARVKD
jgi:hypothetical protein